MEKKYCTLQSIFIIALSIVLLSSLTVHGGETAGLTPSATLSLRYDDNILLNDRDKKSDIVTAISTQISGFYRGKNSNFSLNYEPIYESFSRENSQLNNYGHAGNLSAHLLHGYMEINISDQLRITDSPEQFFIEQAHGLRSSSFSGRQKTTYNDFASRINYQLTGKTSIGLSYANTVTKVELSNEVDSFRNSYDLTIRYTINPKKPNYAYVNAGLNMYNFDTKRVSTLQNEFNLYNYTIGYLYEINRSSSLNMGGGITTYDDTNNIDFIGHFDIITKLKYTAFGIKFSKSIDGGGGTGIKTDLNSLDGNIQYEISQRMTLLLNGNVSRSSSIEEKLKYENLYHLISTQLRYKATYWMSVSIGYIFAKNNFRSKESNIFLINRPDYLFNDIEMIISTRLRSWLQMEIRYDYSDYQEENVTAVLDNSYHNNRVFLLFSAEKEFF